MNSALYFIAGSAIGAGVTYLVCNSIYRKKLKQTEDELFERYNKYEFKKVEHEVSNAPVEQTVEPKNNLKETYGKILNNYVRPSVTPEPVRKPVNNFGPYVIHEYEAGEKVDEKGNKYKIEDTWINYTNNVLVDAQGNVLSYDDICHYIGGDFEDYFGSFEGEDDTRLYIRNDELKIDFEIYNCDEEYHDPTTEDYDN